jgi:putative inorganic carbon (HCO3(-)) transporter
MVKGGRGIVIVSACAILIVLSLLNVDPGVRKRANQVFDLEVNLDRSQIWQANLDMIKDRPLLGWRYGNYKKFRELYYQPYPAAGTHAHAHNNVLQVWVDGGLVGLSAFLFLLWVVSHTGWQVYRSLPAEAEPLRSLALGGTLSILGFLLDGLTSNTILVMLKSSLFSGR